MSIFILQFGTAILPSIAGHWFTDNYNEIKNVTLGILTSAGIFSIRRVFLPSLGGTSIRLTLLLIISFLATHFYQDNWMGLPEIITFLALIFVFLQISESTPILQSMRVPLQWAVMFQTALCLYQIAEGHQFAEGSGSLENVDRIAGSFGNANMCAQFFSLGITILALSPQNSRRRIDRIIGTLAIGFGVGLILLLRCRSAYISVALVGLYAYWTSAHPMSRSLKARIVVCLTAALLLLSVVQSSLVEKKWSSIDRIEMTQETLAMVAQQPFGIGAKTFEFSSIPFSKNGAISPSESVVYESPHNEILRLLISEGWATSALLILVLTVLSLQASKIKFKPDDAKFTERRILVGIFLAMLPELLFQFPLQNPVPEFCAAAAIATFLRIHFKPVTIRTSAWVPILAGFLVFSITLRPALANLLWTTATEADELERACRLAPENWRSCIDAADKLIQDGDLEPAQTLLYGELRRRPANFLALALLGQIRFAVGDISAACDATTRSLAVLKTGYAKNLRNQLGENCDKSLEQSLNSLSPAALLEEQRSWGARAAD